MRNDDDRFSGAAAGVLQELEHLLSRDVVECACRLVAQQDFRVFCQCAGDRNALLFTAVKLGGKIV